jgi:hypothetical protein
MAAGIGWGLRRWRWLSRPGQATGLDFQARKNDLSQSQKAKIVVRSRSP